LLAKFKLRFVDPESEKITASYFHFRKMFFKEKDATPKEFMDFFQRELQGEAS
jgi:hypothetical protein